MHTVAFTPLEVDNGAGALADVAAGWFTGCALVGWSSGGSNPGFPMSVNIAAD
jgi:hypothetical protein